MVRFYSHLNVSFLLKFALVVAAWSLGACTPPKAAVVEKKVVEVPDSLVARVASVYTSEKYVLIQRYGKLRISDDSILYSQGPHGGSANLKVTGERLGQFLAADILSGDVAIGDAVYLRVLKDGADEKGKVLLTDD